MIRKKARFGWQSKFVFPAAVVVGSMAIAPFALLCWQAFHSFNPLEGRNSFAGFDNFVTLWRDSTFGESLRVTFAYAIAASLISLLAGVILGVALSQVGWRRRAIPFLLAPFFTAPVVAALIFMLAVDADLGFVHYFAEWLQVNDPRAMLSRPGRALAVAVALDVWQWSGVIGLFILTRIETVSRPLLELVATSGGSWRARLVSVWAPSLRTPVAGVLAFRFLWCLGDGEKIDALTAGGAPYGAMQVLPIWLSHQYFRNGEYGYGSAASLLLYLVALIGAALVVRMLVLRDKFA